MKTTHLYPAPPDWPLPDEDGVRILECGRCGRQTAFWEDRPVYKYELTEDCDELVIRAVLEA